MPRLYTNTDCPLHGSEYCARLHMESCDTCTVRGRDEEEMQLLKQDQHHPLKQHEQVILLVVALAHTIKDIPLDKISEFNSALLKYIEAQAPYISRDIEQTGKLSEENRNSIIELAEDFQKRVVEGKARLG